MNYKNLIAAATVSLASLGSVSAAATTTDGIINDVRVSVYGIHDYNVSQNGVRIEAEVGKFWQITPTVFYSYIHDTYSRYALGGNLNLIKVGNVGVDLTAAGVWQNTNNGTNGFGLTAGVRGSVDLTDNVALVAGFERFVGQSRVNDFDGNVVSVGVKVKF